MNPLRQVPVAPASGLAVDPAGHLRLGTLLLQLINIAAGVVLSADALGQVTAVPAERIRQTGNEAVYRVDVGEVKYFTLCVGRFHERQRRHGEIPISLLSFSIDDDRAEAILDRLPTHEYARVLKAIMVLQRGGDSKLLLQAILHDFPENDRQNHSLKNKTPCTRRSHPDR